MNTLIRTELLIGKENLELLKSKTILVLGVGGVGSFLVESLARTGIGNIIIVDKDVVSESNLNRQLVANYETIGNSKVEVMKTMVSKYNKECNIITIESFYDSSINNILDKYNIDYIADCIDTMTSKIDIIKYAKSTNIPLISCMGMANKLDPTKIEITDLSKTSYDPVSKIMRNLVKKEKIKGKITVCFSSEIPYKQRQSLNDSNIRKEAMPPSSVIFVPSCAGIIIGSYIVNSLINTKTN